MKWSPRNFRFDELDIYSACIPYGSAHVEVPSVLLRGKTIRIEGRLLDDDLPYKPRWKPPVRVYSFETRWQTFCEILGMGRLKNRLDVWAAQWPKIRRLPSLEVALDGRKLLQHTPSQPNFVIEAELPPMPQSRDSFRIRFRLRNVFAAEILAQVAFSLIKMPMPLTLWKRMRDWQFRSLQHRRLRLVSVWVDGELIVDFRDHSAAPGPHLKKMVRPGLNIAGHFLSEHSIGDAARGSVRAADAAGLQTCLVRLRIPVINRNGDETLRSRLSEAMVYPFTLYHINVREAEEIAQYHGAGWMNGRYNIAYWAWETREFPKRWTHHARLFNEIWTPSRFVTEAIQMCVPLPVLTMPHVIEFPLPETTNSRVKFGLPEGLFLFLFVFDMNSLAGRKNPEAVVEAFRRVASKNPATGLVLKFHNASRNAVDLRSLCERTAGMKNVFLLDRTIARHEVYELMACCDAFVSLHHAEGFGLCVAEAMFLGKPVVSTDWSATAEYVTPQNGFPVRCHLTRLEHHIDEYVRGTEWAEPDVEHAAWCMQRLADDPQMCATLGAQGARDVRERFSAAAVGRRYAQRLDSILFW
ncbi:MAG: glycosyltransferase [Desulfobacteraceae bacterium]|nr:MAG: glycosyltransferase [Desulfobacteraceae bacterium]